MSDSEVKSLSKFNPNSLRKSYFLIAASSLCALLATFVVSNSDFKFEAKILVFISIILLYLLFCLTGYVWQKKESENIQTKTDEKSEINSEVETKLLALEEANQFFGASLKSGDMFRLVASRVKEIVPFAAFIVFLSEPENSKLKIVFAEGENAFNFSDVEIDFNKGLAGKVFQTLNPAFDESLLFDKEVYKAASLKNLYSAIAVPLLRNGEAYGVLQLFGTFENRLQRANLNLFEAVAARVAPLFLNSLAFEENLANALTDSLTNLPNERAFFLVLENQIAESQRYREARPLNILTIDIQNFDELNQQYGHAIGDRILKYAADNIKNQLRQMDFLARAAGDEFLAILPTASDTVAQEIIERIRKSFVLKPFEVSTDEKINLQLNFGAASFWKQGETAAELLKQSYLRKKQSKTTENNNVLWFPKEYVN